MTGPRRSFVPGTDGVTIAVHDHGGGGSPLLLVHANGFHARCWDPVVEHLGGRYRCVALDLRGHGDSTLPDGAPVDWGHSAQDLLAVVDALELGRGLRVAGWSMGGCIALLAELARPGTLGAAFLFEPIVVPATPRMPGIGNPMAETARRRREVFASRDEAYERFASRPPFSRCDPVALRAYVDHGFRDQDDGTVILKCRAETEARNFESAATGAFERLDEITAPVTVGASGDGEMPAQLAPAVAERLPRGRLVRFDDLTHFAPLEDPALIAEAIAEATR